MVIGGSMGGMQALEWVAQAPEIIESCVPIASTSMVSPLAIAFDSVGRASIMAQLTSGHGEAGLALLLDNWGTSLIYRKMQWSKSFHVDYKMPQSTNII